MQTQFEMRPGNKIWWFVPHLFFYCHNSTVLYEFSVGVTTIYEEGPAVFIRTKKSFSLWPSWNFDVQSTRNKKFFEESFRWWWTFKSLNRFPYQGEIDFEFLIIITGSCSSKRPPKIVVVLEIMSSWWQNSICEFAIPSGIFVKFNYA